MKQIIAIAILLFALMPIFAQTHCGSCTAGQTPAVSGKMETTPTVLSTPNKAQWISKDYYILYDWNKKPKIGSHILSVKVYDKSKKQITNLAITADAYMPSMKNSKAAGDITMKMNKKGEFLVPINFVAQGDWEILLKFAKGDESLANATIRLEVK